MRTDLEAAMGAVLTTFSAGQALTEDSAEYLSYFDLDDGEKRVLEKIAADLVAMAPSFIEKRESALRGHARLTLEMLGDAGRDLLVEYSESFAPLDTFADEALRFSDFMVEETARLAATVPFGAVIADVARFERLKLRSFTYEAAIRPAVTVPFLHIRQADPLCRLELHPSVKTDEFAHDVRTVRLVRDLGRAAVDPCILLCCLPEDDREVMTFRIDSETRGWLDSIEASDGSSTLGSVLSGAADGSVADAGVHNLLAIGAVRVIS